MAYNLAMCYRGTGQAARAVPLFQRALAVYRTRPGMEDEGTLTTMNQLAAAYVDARDYPGAERLLRECLDIRTRIGPDAWQRFHTMSQLGAALAGQKRWADAEPLLTDGYRGLKDREAKIPEVLRKVVAEAAARVVSLYEDWGKPGKATSWREKLRVAAAASPPRP
jgi:hypothetical protein